MMRVIAVLLLIAGVTLIGWNVVSYFKKAPLPEPTPTPAPELTPAPWSPVCVRAIEQITEHYVPVRDSETGQIIDWKIKKYTPPIKPDKYAMLVDGDVQEWTYTSQPLYKLVWQSPDDPYLARHPMLKKSQHNWVFAHLVEKAYCYSVPRSVPAPAETPAETPPPTPKPTPDTVAPIWYIPTLNAKVTELRFFESDYDMPPRNQRVYAKRFQSTETRYIAWELVLSHPRVSYSTAWAVRAICFNSQGEFWRQEKQMTTREGWINSYYNHSYGNRTAGAFWKPGNYRIDIWVEHQKVASGIFEIY